MNSRAIIFTLLPVFSVRFNSKLAASAGRALFSSPQLQAVCPSGQALPSLFVQQMSGNRAAGAAFGTQMDSGATCLSTHSITATTALSHFLARYPSSLVCPFCYEVFVFSYKTLLNTWLFWMSKSKETSYADVVGLPGTHRYIYIKNRYEESFIVLSLLSTNGRSWTWFHNPQNSSSPVFAFFWTAS